MADANNSKHKDYARYAAHCLNLVPRSKISKIVPLTAKWRLNGLGWRMPPSNR